jgi:hypothetical protein
LDTTGERGVKFEGRSLELMQAEAKRGLQKEMICEAVSHSEATLFFFF